MSKILKAVFALFFVMVFIFGTFALISVNSFALKVETPDPHPGADWAISHCGINDGLGDFCAGVGKYNCCLK